MTPWEVIGVAKREVLEREQLGMELGGIWRGILAARLSRCWFRSPSVISSYCKHLLSTTISAQGSFLVRSPGGPCDIIGMDASSQPPPTKHGEVSKITDRILITDAWNAFDPEVIRDDHDRVTHVLSVMMDGDIRASAREQSWVCSKVAGCLPKYPLLSSRCLV
jgi:hypothetical protein